jgi:serine/threonine protein kinase
MRAARPITISCCSDKVALVLEDPVGEPLNQFVDGAMELRLFLRIAISIADAIGQLHKQRMIHKDLKSAKVLFELDRGRVWLTSFGIASRMTREHQAPEPLRFIAGTLAYMAPEQTGRMTCWIDSRTDLSAFGATLYELLPVESAIFATNFPTSGYGPTRGGSVQTIFRQIISLKRHC